ncbi:hypothetical protein C2857_000888 [Epichloe festucae Fl1]|uniref:Uncharacterized protein n=1 Tax=Epichloe festucae (strain Fl1) TaxID=877507 RepID=A0A7U3PZT1_EPIFF|nr:hypothetical protein C2857_000888 [Epichloe festucae Fl1]
MLPPVDENVIRDNPGFAKLYQMLLKDVLNPDGSTKHDVARHERDAVQQDLHQLRINRAKHILLETAISAVSLPDSKSQPSESLRTMGKEEAAAGGSLADLLVLLPSLMSNDQQIDPDDATRLLQGPPLSELESLLPDLCNLVSANLHASALGVARITHPSTNPSYLHRHIPSLPTDHAALGDKLSEARSALTKSRLEALVSLTELLNSHLQSLTLVVRSLEFKHGLASRRLELQALDVSQESQQTEIDAKNTLNDVSKDMYSTETISALMNYSSHLKDAQIRATERLRGLQAELAEYGVGIDADRGKEKTMRELARIYHEIETQMEDVKKDLDRLDKRA